MSAEEIISVMQQATRRIEQLERENAVLRTDNQTMRKLLQDWYDWEHQAFRDRMNDRDGRRSEVLS